MRLAFRQTHQPFRSNGGVLETIITNIDIHTKERKSNVVDIKQNMLDLG